MRDKAKHISLICLMLLAGLALAEEVLSREFLDYMATFETDDGEWIDPEELEAMAGIGAKKDEGEEDE